MKKIEFVYREILYQVLEKNERRLTQSFLSKELNISLSVINHALKPLRKMNAVDVKQRGFDVIDAKKILYFWASIRNLDKDIIYKTRVEMPVYKIENSMPDDVIYGGYSAYKFKFKDVPADYSEVYVYGDISIKERFPQFSEKYQLARLGVHNPGFTCPCSRDGTFRIVSCSFLIKLKRIDLLIEGIAKLAGMESLQKILWHHIGCGPLKDRLNKYAQQKFPENVRYTFLGQISNRIINRVKGINRVVYDISSKPPATIEWE